ncbi:MAG: serine hydrolase domain-containing protein [Pseudomonadota bacterium]
MSYPRSKVLESWCAIAILASALATNAIAQNSAQNDVERLERALTAGIAMGIPGISAAIGVGDSVVWAGTAGYNDLVRQVPLSINDRFGVGSITKTFVARVILQLVAEGKLELDKTPQEYLDLDIVRSIPNTGTATLRHLLNHQSGIPTWEFQEDWIRKGRGAEMELGHVWAKTETLKYSTNDLLSPTGKPGERYSYSNTNYTILGLIIEAVTGNDAAAELRKRLLEPLGLENTFLESFEDVPGGYVHHYHYATPEFDRAAGVHRGFTQIRPYVVESTAGNLSPEWTAGGIVASASDLVKWAQELRDGTMLTPEMHREALSYYPPRERGDTRRQYLQGISKTKDYYDGHARLGHGGGTLGFSAGMYWLEDTDVVVVVLTNIGAMHSGLGMSPVSVFINQLWFPAVMKYLGR